MVEIVTYNEKYQAYLNRVKRVPILVSSNSISIHQDTEKHLISKCPRDSSVFSKWNMVVSDLAKICIGLRPEVARIPGRLIHRIELF